MPTRRATYSDLKPMAEVLAAAFYDEGLNRYFFPHRKEYPQDYLRLWYQMIVTRWWDYDSIWLVSYEGSGAHVADGGGGVSGTHVQGPGLPITGVAQWSRFVAQPGLLQRIWRLVDPSKRSCLSYGS